MKTVYRRGLGHPLRAGDAGHLGRALQLLVPGALLAGASPTSASSHDPGQDFRSDSYFALLRNYRRHGWIVLYLFGNSPAICPSFLQGRKVDWLRGVRARQSLRAVRHLAAHERPRLPQQEPGGPDVSVNSLDHYMRDLTHAITTPHPDYEKIGVKVDGEYRQLNANLLQIENEYYSFIRPKRVTHVGRAPDQGAAARRRAVRRDALARRERVRPGRRQPEQAALPRGVRRVLRAERRARRSSRRSSPSSMATTRWSRARAAGRA